MPNDTAKLFFDGGSQAVRLPAEFRFDGVDEVFVRRDTVTGDVILSATDRMVGWDDVFSLRDHTEVPAEFMDDQPAERAVEPEESTRRLMLCPGAVSSCKTSDPNRCLRSIR